MKKNLGLVRDISSLLKHGHTLRYVPVMPMSPEAYGLPAEMSQLAQLIHRDSGGGLGDFYGGLVRGLFTRGIPTFPTSPNYTKMFKKFSGLDEEQYMKKIHTTPAEHVILISSRRFSRADRIYFNNNRDNARRAADFQDQVPGPIKTVRSNHGGKVIVHTSDQHVGGVTNAYCRLRGIPNVHTAHNLITLFLPFDYFNYRDLSDDGGIGHALYKAEYEHRTMIDAHATAVKNCDMLVFPGKQFGKEVIGQKQEDLHYAGRYDDPNAWPMFKEARNTIEEIKIKFDQGQVRFVPNGLSPHQLPEYQTYLPFSYGPDTKDIIGAKTANEFWPDDILNYYEEKYPITMIITCRPNDEQKGFTKMIKAGVEILHKNPDTRLIAMGDDLTPNQKYANLVKHEQNYLPQGRLIQLPHDQKKSNQLYAKGAIFVDGHEYEPFGYGIAQSIACATIPVVPYNGGSVDMVREFSPENNRGNGFFHNNSIEDLAFQLQNAVNMTRELRKNPELANKNYRRMMTEIRTEFSLDNMIDGYLEIYDELGYKFNLFNNGYKPFLRK